MSYKYKLKDFARGYYGKSKNIVSYSSVNGHQVRISKWIRNGEPIGSWNVEFLNGTISVMWLKQPYSRQTFTSIHEVIRTINKFIEDCGI